MCESNAFLKDGENEVMLMESVDTIEPCEDGLKLMDIFGKQIFIKAKIKEMTLLNHRIILEKF
ncbi:CooT family nickel-binding protein [Desulfosporosinus fructosivorans]